MTSIAARAIQMLSSARARPVAELVEEWLADERHQLVLFIPVLLGCGIGMWFLLPTEASWIAGISACLGVAVSGVLAEGLTRRCILFAGLLLAGGIALAWGHAAHVAAPVLERERFGMSFSGEILAVEEQPARGRTRLLIRPTSVFDPDMTVRVSLRGDVPDGIAPGALVTLRAGLTPPPGPSVPGGYHFARRAWFEGIGATGFSMGEIVVDRAAPPPTGFRALLASARADLTRQLQDGVGGRAGGVAAALVTGDRGGIDPEVTEAMRDSGLAHLIAISGLHFAVVVGGTLWLVRRLLTLWPWFALRYDARVWAAAVAAAAGIAYMLIAGSSVPTVRACIAVLIVLIGLAAGREAISLRLVAVGATIILVWRPDYLLSPSFQLSFAAVTGIVALYQSPWGRKWSAPDRSQGWLARSGRSIAALLMTGIVAELTIGPIALFHFNQMGIYGIGANLIAIPLTSFVIIPLLILAVIAQPFGIEMPVHQALNHALEGLIRLAEITAALPGAVGFAPAMPVSAIVLMVLGGLWFCIWQTRRRWTGLAPVVVGIGIAVTAPQPDLFVDPAGRHVAVVTEDGIAMLRPRVGDYISEMWSGAAGVHDLSQIEGAPGASCSRDSCRLDVTRRSRTWRIFATRSKDLIGRAELEPVCRDADIVVSDRSLPDWCRPRWLLLNRRELERLGAVSIDLDRGTLRSSVAEDGEHPWARTPPMPRAWPSSGTPSTSR